MKENYCGVHKDQKLSHYIENTNEIICVYCAFNRYKTSPSLQIKELTEKCSEIIKFIEKFNSENIISNNKLTTSLNRIKENFSHEEENINKLYDSFIQVLEEKKKENINNITNLYELNLKKIQEKIHEITEKSEICEGIKDTLADYISGNNKKIDLSKIFSYYSTLVKESQLSHTNFIELKEFKYYFEDPSKILKLLSSLGDLRTKNSQLILSNGIITSSLNNDNIKRNNFANEFNDQKRKNYNKDLFESKDLLDLDNEKGKISEKQHKNGLDFRQKKEMSFNVNKPNNSSIPLQQNLIFNYKDSLNTHESNYSISNI